MFPGPGGHQGQDERGEGEDHEPGHQPRDIRFDQPIEDDRAWHQRQVAEHSGS